MLLASLQTLVYDRFENGCPAICIKACMTNSSVSLPMVAKVHSVSALERKN